MQNSEAAATKTMTADVGTQVRSLMLVLHPPRKTQNQENKKQDTKIGAIKMNLVS